MEIDGGCHCGHVRYEATVDADDVSICHCTDCQALTGSAFRVTLAVRREAVRLTAAPPKLYVKTGDNGRKRHQYFCPECGSPLFTAGEGDEADAWGIRWGSIRQRADLPPTSRIWCRSAPPWTGRVDALPGRDTD